MLWQRCQSKRMPGEPTCKGACSCRYSKWQIDSTGRRLEQECLVEKLKRLLQQDLEQSCAKRVTQ